MLLSTRLFACILGQIECKFLWLQKEVQTQNKMWSKDDFWFSVFHKWILCLRVLI